METAKLSQVAYDNISKQVIEQTKDLTKEEVVQLLIQSLYEKNRVRDIANLRKNALFDSKRNSFQLQLFDPDQTDEQPDQQSQEFSDEEIQAQIEQWQKEHLENLKFARDDIDQKIKAAESVINRKGKQSSRPSHKTTAGPVNKKPDEEITYTVDETCPYCGEKLQHLGYKSHVKIEYVPATYKIVIIHQETAVCPNHCTDENGTSHIATASLPAPDPFPGSYFTPSLAAGFAFNKLIEGLPFYRIEHSLEYYGMSFSHQNMCNGTIKAAEVYIHPVVEYMKKIFRTLSIIHMDETTLQCLQYRKERKTSTMVVACSGEYAEMQMCIFYFSVTKEQTFVEKLIGPDYSGFMMTDGADPYSKYPGKGKECHCKKGNCMAHARRKIYESIDCRQDFQEFKKCKTPEEQIGYIRKNPSLGILLQALSLFSLLYDIERKFSGSTPEQLTQVRNGTSRLVLKCLTEVMKEIESGFPKSSQAQNAAVYYLDREKELSAYLEDGRYPIDNNRAERCVKSFVISRKNFLFSGSERGAVATADHMTILQSARMNGLNPCAYEAWLIQTLAAGGRLTDELLDSVLPWSKNVPGYLKTGQRQAD